MELGGWVKRLRRRLPDLTYALGVGCASAVGFCSPAWFTGFAPLAAGLIYAAFELVDDGEEVTSGHAQGPPRR